MIFFVSVLFFSFVLSYIASRKGKDFLFAGRSVGWLLMFGTLLGTQVGAGFLLGNSEAVWKFGWVGSFYGFGLALGLLGFGLGYAYKFRSFEVDTLPQLLKNRYKSGGFQRFSGLLSIISMAGVLVAHAVGLQKFLVSLGNGGNTIFFLCWVSVVVYTTLGGFLAVVWTDVVQALLILATLGVMVVQIFVPYTPEIISEAIRIPCSIDQDIFSTLFIPTCFIFIAPHMIQRCSAARTPRDASRAFVATAVALCILAFVPLCCGLLASYLHLSPDQGALFMQVAKALASPLVFSCAAIAVLLALISTTSSVLLAITGNIVRDTGVGHGKEKMITALIGLGAYGISFLSQDIVGWLIASYEICVVTLFVPVLMAVYSRRFVLPVRAAWAAVGYGIVGLLSRSYVGWVAPVFPLFLSACGYWIHSRAVALRSEVVVE